MLEAVPERLRPLGAAEQDINAHARGEVPGRPHYDAKPNAYAPFP